LKSFHTRSIRSNARGSQNFNSSKQDLLIQSKAVAYPVENIRVDDDFENMIEKMRNGRFDEEKKMKEDIRKQEIGKKKLEENEAKRKKGTQAYFCYNIFGTPVEVQGNVWLPELCHKVHQVESIPEEESSEEKKRKKLMMRKTNMQQKPAKNLMGATTKPEMFALMKRMEGGTGNYFYQRESRRAKNNDCETTNRRL
jgi:hypothetical protein